MISTNIFIKAVAVKGIFTPLLCRSLYGSYSSKFRKVPLQVISGMDQGRKIIVSPTQGVLTEHSERKMKEVWVSQ
jgi:hypothetical protein